jgi:Family of unknown function (DUF5681)
VKFAKGTSGNPQGRPKGKPTLLAGRIRALIDGNAADILAKVIEQAKAGDSQAQAAFLKLLPKYRVVMTTVEMPVAQSAGEAQEQIAMLTTMAARGDLDLDALQILSRSLTLAIDTRLTQLRKSRRYSRRRSTCPRSAFA